MFGDFSAAGMECCPSGPMAVPGHLASAAQRRSTAVLFFRRVRGYSSPSGRERRQVKLFWSSRSPFVRKVMVAAHEVGIAGRIRTERVVVAANKPNADVMAVNPLNKIPTLVLDDGTRALQLARDLRVLSTRCTRAPKLFPSDRGCALDGAAAPGARRRPDGGRACCGSASRPAAEKRNPRRIWRPTGSRSPATLDVLEREAEGLAGPIGHRPHRHRLRAGAPRLPLRRRRLARGPAQARGAGMPASRAARRCRPPSMSTLLI